MIAHSRFREARKAMSASFPSTSIVSAGPAQPPRSRDNVFCVAATELQAEAIVNPLTFFGLKSEQISVLFPETARDWTRYAGAGRESGAAWAWMPRHETVYVEGLGPSIAVGPILALFDGRGRTAGGLAAALMEIGIPEYEARKYEGKVRSGNILIAARADSRLERSRVRDIFERAGAQNISYTE